MQYSIAAELRPQLGRPIISAVAARRELAPPLRFRRHAGHAAAKLRRLVAIAAVLLAAGFLTGPPLAEAAPRSPQGPIRFLDHWGTVLHQLELYLIYWGSSWKPAAVPSPTASEITTAMRTMMASVYMTGLQQYRSIGRGYVRGSAIITTSDPPVGFTDRHVRRFLDGQLDAGTVPAPDRDGETVYAVIMPTGATPGDEGLMGKHSSYIRKGRPIHFFWAAAFGNLDVATGTLSHEVVESATDPEGTGFRGVPRACTQDGWCEIGDICTSTVVLDGITVQSYWSNEAGTCIVPGRLADGSLMGNR